MLFLIVLVFISFKTAGKEYGSKNRNRFFALAVLLGGTIFFGNALGKGAVVLVSMPYAQQLREGRVYTLLAESRSGKDRILFLRSGDGVFHTIRVKGNLPPAHFRLVNGRPVSVAVTTVPEECLNGGTRKEGKTISNTTIWMLSIFVGVVFIVLLIIM